MISEATSLLRVYHEFASTILPRVHTQNAELPELLRVFTMPTSPVSSTLLFSELQARGLVHQTTPVARLTSRLAKGPMALYCGFDPTAESLHVGHLQLLSLLRRLQRAGNRVFIVLGGATGRVGDPSFKAKERNPPSFEQLAHCAAHIQAQISQLFEADGGQPPRFVNNLEWTQDQRLLDFLREFGKEFAVNAMIQQDAIRERLLRPESGISFTEFSYVLLQAFDFYSLYKKEGVELQIGGSDQWGNVVAGVRLIQRKLKKQVYAWTVPLLLQPNGEKFGKTAGGTVWLDPAQTSPYQFYQFWFSTPDEQAWDYLLRFTEIPQEELEAFRGSSGSAPNAAQARLAYHMTAWVHGKAVADQIVSIQSKLFHPGGPQLDSGDLGWIEASGCLPVLRLPSQSISVAQAWNLAGLCESRAQAKQLLKAGGLYADDQRLPPQQTDLLPKPEGESPFTLIRKGKTDYALVVWEGLKASGSSSPPAVQ